MKSKLIIFITILFIPIILLGQPDTTKLKNDKLKAGLIYGKYHAFMLNTADGWILDNTSGVNQGLHAVFYPENQTWQSSPVIVYARARVKQKDVNTIDDQIEATLKGFREGGSHNIKAKFVKEIDLENNKKAKIYFYTGDKWGNYEAAAYINEKKTIIFIIFHAKNKELFSNFLDSYYEIVKSYLFLTDHPEIKQTKKE